MIQIEHILKAPKSQRDFLESYLRMISTFASHVHAYEFCTNKNDTPIKNTDLWIESYIGMFPGLQKFRNYVRSEMERLNIVRYDDYVYEPKTNHYFYSNRRQLDDLKMSID